LYYPAAHHRAAMLSSMMLIQACMTVPGVGPIIASAINGGHW
jgi:hypothetical protein